MSAISWVLPALALLLLLSAGTSIYAMIQGYRVLRRLFRNSRDEDSILLKSPMAPGISVVTAPNDVSAESRAWVRRLLDLHYGNHEVVVVLDGPEAIDRDKWIAEFRLAPAPRQPSTDLKSAPIRGIYESFDPIRIVLVDKERGGHSDALNAGVNIARFPVIAWAEPASRFEPNLLLRLVRPMMENPDETVAVCAVAPEPESQSWAARFGTCAFLRTWLVRCAASRGWNRLVPVPGAAVLVPRDAVVAARGFRSGVADLCLRLHAAARLAKAPYQISLLVEPVVLPPSISGWRDLSRGISRDQSELGQLVFHWPRGAGLRGRLGILWFRLGKPLLEVVGYPLALTGWILGWFDTASVLLFLIASAGAGMVLSTAAVVLPALARERGPEPLQIKRLFLSAVLENLGYRQFRNLSLVTGFFRAGH